MPDADRNRGSVQVTVLDPTGNGRPYVGIDVLISDPDGTPYETATTDVSGNAFGHALPGGSITVLSPSPDLMVTSTVVGVMPGDVITIGQVQPLSQAAGSLHLTFTPNAGASYYTVYTACGRTDFIQSSPATVVVQTPCDTISVLLVARDSAGNVIATTWVPPAPFVDGATVDLSGAWIAVSTFTGNITNIPPAVHSLAIARSSPVGVDPVGTNNEAIDPSPGSLSLAMPLLGGPTARVEFGALDAGGYGAPSQGYIRVIDPALASVDIDLASELLPWISPVSFDASTSTVHETASAGAAPSIVQHRISWNSGDQRDWLIYTPSIGDFTPPQLPAPYMPPSGVHGILYVTASYSDAFATYATARQLPAQALAAGYGTPGTAGTVWLSSGNDNDF